MSVLESFNSSATGESGYIAFDKLAVGSYKIEKFSIMKKSTYGGKRLLVHLANPEGYIILPERMNKFAVQSEINKVSNNIFLI